MPFYPNDMLSYTFLTRVVNEKPSKEAIKQSYVGTQLMPFREVPTRKLSWDVVFSENNLAGYYGPKGQAVPGDDILFSTVFANLIDIKASRELDPDQIMTMRGPGALTVFNAAAQVPELQAKVQLEQRHVAERLDWCNSAVDSQVEYTIWQLLSTGQVMWPPLDSAGAAITSPMPHWNANQRLRVVFPMRNEFKQKASTLVGYNGRVNTTGRVAWTNAAADIIQDLEIILELVLETTGVSMEGATVWMSRTLLSKLAFNSTLLTWIAGSNKEQQGARQFASVGEIKTFLETKLGWKIQTYDAHWTYRQDTPNSKPTIHRVPFMGRGKVVIIPQGMDLGYMATTFLKQGDGNYRSGKYAWSYEQPKPPHEMELGVNVVAWPVVEQYDWFILDADS